MLYKKLKKMSILAGVICCVLLLSGSSQADETKAPQLLDQVLSLKLGLDNYSIGQVLTPGQKQEGLSHLEPDAYKGTYKFSDKDLYIVVDKVTDRILALYKRQVDVDKNGLKFIVGNLMNRFDAPTLLAHDKILYWAFNKHGAISEEDFNRAKDAKQIPNLGIIATVKLNSDIEITPDSKEDKEESATDKAASTGTVYFVITSDPLVQQFMSEHN
jgi:hypothetical protein